MSHCHGKEGHNPDMAPLRQALEYTRINFLLVTASVRDAFGRYIGVERQLWKLREDKSAPRPKRGRRLVFVGIVAVLLTCGGTGMVVVRAKLARKAAAGEGKRLHQTSGLKLLDKKVSFATGTIQTLDLRLPCSGLLSINVNFPKETCLNVFLVPLEERAKMGPGKTFRHVPGFDAKTTSGRYQRTARLPAGSYAMVLLDESGSRSVVAVNAYLRELK